MITIELYFGELREVKKVRRTMFGYQLDMFTTDKAFKTLDDVRQWLIYNYDPDLLIVNNDLNVIDNSISIA